MEQRDYLLKQAEQLGQVLGKILLKLLGLKDPVTLEVVNHVFTEELDFDVSRLIDVDEDKWLDTLRAEKQFNPEDLERLADILLFVAEDVDLNLDERDQLYKKCRMIYEYLDESTRTYSFDRYFKMKRIKEYIDEIASN